jgi:imidazole glycerol-phosphate synthase subunit HisH
MIGVLSYGVGNVAAIVTMLTRMSYTAALVGTAEELSKCDRFVLPGVGAFDDVAERFNNSDLRQPLTDLVMNHGRPLLGICVGMQILADASEEGDEPGLGWIPGRVRHLAHVVDSEMRIPSFGWHYTGGVPGKSVIPTADERQRFYFAHSYFFDCADSEDVAATVDYGVSVTAAVQQRNISGVQFHPEKSHRFGMQVLRNFADWKPE